MSKKSTAPVPKQPMHLVRLMRVNDFVSAKTLKQKDDLGHKKVRDKNFKPRERARGEATPMDSSLHWKHRPIYKVGDMDHNNQVMRPGSDHSHIKSFGGRT